MELLAPEPSGLGFAEGAEAVVESVATGVAQARQMALQRDAEGAVNILRRLDTPAVREYRALRVALHSAKAVAFVTQQCTGLGLGCVWGTGFVVQRLEGHQLAGLPSWSAPSYFRSRALCGGLVVGYEYVQSLLVFTGSERVMQQFVDGELHVGANLSLMAGSDMLRHMAARPRKVDATHSDALVFTIAAGAMANLSLQVGWTSPDPAMNRTLFGQLTLFGTHEVTPQQLLSGAVPPPHEFRQLYSILGRHASQKPWT